MSMSLERQIERQRRVTDGVQSLMRAAQMESRPHAAILADYTALRDRELVAGVSRCVKEYCRGYFFAVVDSLYRTELTYGGLWAASPTGLATTDRDRADYYKKLGLEPAQFGTLHGLGHYWAHSAKPFFISKEL